MNSASLFVFALCVVVAYALPFEEKVQDAEDIGEREQRSTGCSQAALAALKHYHVNIKQSTLNCHPHQVKQFDQDFALGLKKREMEYNRGRYTRGAACCEPECAWLIEYLGVDPSVMVCV